MQLPQGEEWLNFAADAVVMLMRILIVFSLVAFVWWLITGKW